MDFRVYLNDSAGNLTRRTIRESASVNDALARFKHEYPGLIAVAVVKGDDCCDEPGFNSQTGRKAWLDKIIADGTGWAVVDGKVVERKPTSQPATPSVGTQRYKLRTDPGYVFLGTVRSGLDLNYYDAYFNAGEDMVMVATGVHYWRQRRNIVVDDAGALARAALLAQQFLAHSDKPSERPVEAKPTTLAESTHPADLKMMASDTKPKAPPTTPARFDPFKDFIVGSVDTGDAPSATGHVLQSMTDLDNISRHGSAFLL